MRRTMISILFIVVLSTPAQADVQMKPIQDILASENPVAVTTVMLERCSALYLVIGNWLKTQADQRLNTMGNTYEAEAVFATQAWVMFQEIKLNLSKQKILEIYTNRLEIIMPEYEKLMSRSKAVVGDVFGDPIVKSDFLTCKNLRKITEDRLKNLTDE